MSTCAHDGKRTDDGSDGYLTWVEFFMANEDAEDLYQIRLIVRDLLARVRRRDQEFAALRAAMEG